MEEEEATGGKHAQAIPSASVIVPEKQFTAATTFSIGVPSSSSSGQLVETRGLTPELSAKPVTVARQEKIIPLKGLVNVPIQQVVQVVSNGLGLQSTTSPMLGKGPLKKGGSNKAPPQSKN
ncbi:unnamed protein product [Linum trigynum]|uniref:Uncharacterized protein n=1 Tax=Linum trigynum TaxID=586398 RepID=A0AAV2DTC7_9ROSI